MIKRALSRVRTWFARERNRAYLYRVLLAVGAGAVAYGVLSEQEVEVIALILGEVLGVGLAARNTTTKEN